MDVNIDTKPWQFKPGNKVSAKPHVHKQTKIRQAFMKCVTLQDVQECYGVLMGAVRKGQPWAVKEFLDRTMGKAQQHVTIEQQSLQLQLVEQIVNGSSNPQIDQTPSDPARLLPQ